MTWEAEGWEEGEENAAEVESAGTDAAESTSIGNMDEYDDGGYYFVADTRSAESQQVIRRACFVGFLWNVLRSMQHLHGVYYPASENLFCFVLFYFVFWALIVCRY